MLAMAATARSAETASLKDAYKDDFKVGAAINRTIAMNACSRGQRQRNQEQVYRTLLWSNSIQPGLPGERSEVAAHPSATRADGYDFAPAAAS